MAGVPMSLYVILKFLHVLMAIVAVGFNASYFIWFAIADREPGAALVILRGVKRLDDRFANPAYGLLLILGLAMVITAGIPFTTFWIAAAIVLYIILIVVAVVGYTPTLKRQIAALESGGTSSDTYMQLKQRSNLIGIVLMLDVLVIVFLMVVKPAP
ncbi:MAG: DUF2269 family protein [Chloroflexi bacterium]|nr:DUF2269 family protein [Chloroflexota bacterium]MBV9895451.1 DUF2269 family protein [Chloroflexota bacterium]